MKNYIYLLLLLSVICSDYRRPTKSAKNCLIMKYGEEETKQLLAGLRKYHRSHGKATFYEYILAKKPELKEEVEECLMPKIRRRLETKKGKTKKSAVMEYYLQSIIKDKKVKKKIMRGLSRKTKSKAVKKCKKYLAQKGACKYVVRKLLAKKNKKMKRVLKDKKNKK